MTKQKGKISDEIGLKQKRADEIIDFIRHLFLHENMTEDKIFKEIEKKYKTQVEKTWAGYVLGMVKGERIHERDSKMELLKTIADVLMPKPVSNARLFNAAFGAIVFYGSLLFTTLAFVSMVADFNWWKVASLIINAAFAAMIYWLHQN